MSQQPAHKIRIGNVQVTIWRNSSEKGTWYSAVPSRSFKNGDDQWRNTDALGQDDLLAMQRLLGQAFDWITVQAEADRKAKKDAEQLAG